MENKKVDLVAFIETLLYKGCKNKRYKLLPYQVKFLKDIENKSKKEQK